MLHISISVGLLLSLTVSAAIADAPPKDRLPLLKNGDLSKLDDKNWPADWPHPDGATFEKEGDVRFLRLKSAKPGQSILLYRRVDLPSPAPAGLEIRLRVRYADIKPGKQAWNDGRVIAHFKSQSGRTLKPEPTAPNFRGSSSGWIERTYFAKTPVSAAYFEIMPGLLEAGGGTLDVTECQVFAASEEQLAAARPKIIPSETLVVGKSAIVPPELRVNANQLQTRDGKAVWLQGLCVDSLEWSAAGERIEKSVPTAIDEWKANVIRLPVKDDFWFGRGKKDDGLAYRKTIDAAIEAAAARKAYVVLDLHRFGAPTTDCIAFWKDAASRYKNHPAVLFELMNEPHGISWKLWRDGGNLTDPKSKDELTGETTPGMQALLDAVRTTGASNVVIAGGLDWSYDLSGIVNGFALQDSKTGNGIVYSSHIYPWKRGWKDKVLAAAEKHPLFLGEVGCPPDWKGFEFIPESSRVEDLSKHEWPPDMLGLIQKHKLNWTGFSFHPKCGPMVISDWQYTPTPYWGAFVKEALAGKQFEVKKMR